MMNVAYNISVIIILYTKDKWSHEASNAFFRNAILLSGAKFPPFFFADLIVLSNFADRSRKYEVPWVSLSIRSPMSASSASSDRRFPSPVLLAFLNFGLAGLRREFRTDVALMEMQRHELFSDKMRLTLLQLPCFTKEIDECETIFEKIIYVLKHMEILQRMPFLAQSAVFKRLSEIADVASLTKEERRQYDEDLKHYRDTIAVMHGQFLEGETKGRAETNIANALKMKVKGYPIEDIAEITGLTADEIAAL